LSPFEFGAVPDDIELIRTKTEQLRREVTSHPIYSAVRSVPDMAVFAEHHVFAVWDFMSLLKALQRKLTCVTVPWLPTGSTTGRRLVNDIVLVEESDELDGGYASHFELYRAAMADLGANTAAIDGFLEMLRRGVEVPTALLTCGAPPAAVEFVITTWEVVSAAPLHGLAAAFAFGREELIPEMFDKVLATAGTDPRLRLFRQYLQRHIEVDADEHGPMAMRMLTDLCGDDIAKWDQSLACVQSALRSRARLWDGVVTTIEDNRKSPGKYARSGHA
jgi:hypothetical protein